LGLARPAGGPAWDLGLIPLRLAGGYDQEVSSEAPVVAVVDDDPSVCKAVQRLLRSAGWTATTFGSGIDLLASLEAQVPDCVVLDISMPVMDGLEVLSQLRERNLTMPVILISAEESYARDVGRLSAWGCGFLEKPFDGLRLITMIAAALAPTA
jgi:FixJ family two-component response regulator